MSTDRKRFLGGSDAAAVLGVSPWETPLHLYMQKRGELPQRSAPDPQREKILRRGKRMEPIVVDMLIEEHGLEVTKRSSPEKPNRYAYAAPRDYLAAEVDFEWLVTKEIVAHFADQGVEIPARLIGTVQNGEVKTAHPFVAMRKFGDEGTDEIPVEYAAQAMHGLMVAARDLCLVALLVGSDNLVIYWVRRDEDTIAAMEEAEVNFWERHVLAGNPPAPRNLPDVHLLFGRSTETRKEATPEVAALVASLYTTRNTKATLEETEEGLKFQIGLFLLGAEPVEKQKEPGKHVLVYQGEPILAVNLQSQDRLDTDKLKLKFPEAAAECVRASSSFVYRKPKKGTK